MNWKFKNPYHSFPVLLILAIWIVSFTWVSPLHEFPLNDDWSYSYTVKKLVEEGNYELTNWIAGPQVTQTLWGALFCLPFGFSFIALKTSTLVIGIIGLIVLYFLVFKLVKNRLVATIACITMGLNPIFFSLSATFMTDIHFFTWFILSVYSFINYEEKHESKYWVAATLFSLLAILTRQFGIVAPAALLVYKLISTRKVLSAEVIKYLSSTAFVFAGYLIYTYWLQSNNQLPEYYRNIGDVLNTGLSELLFRTFMRIGYIIHGLGFWLLPVSIPIFISERWSIKKHIKAISILTFILLLPMIRVLANLPSGNIFNYQYIGVLSTYDTFILKQIPLIFQTQYSGILFKTLSFIGGILFVNLIILYAIRAIKTIGFYHANWSSKETVLLIALISLLLYLGVVMINFTYFDRYMIPLAFLSIIILFSQNPQPFSFKPVTLALLIFMGFIGLTQTKNYIAWNKCRWELFQYAMNNGIEPKLIDGGHEFNGWYGDKIDCNGQWDVNQKKYVVSFMPITGYLVIKTAQFKLVLNKLPQNMYLLEKLPNQ
jgi:4-amino-4-deoxy-L-arabinose transferase-like glycosyltransferase